MTDIQTIHSIHSLLVFIAMMQMVVLVIFFGKSVSHTKRLKDIEFKLSPEGKRQMKYEAIDEAINKSIDEEMEKTTPYKVAPLSQDQLKMAEGMRGVQAKPIAGKVAPLSQKELDIKECEDKGN